MVSLLAVARLAPTRQAAKGARGGSLIYGQAAVAGTSFTGGGHRPWDAVSCAQQELCGGIAAGLPQNMPLHNRDLYPSPPVDMHRNGSSKQRCAAAPVPTCGSAKAAALAGVGLSNFQLERGPMHRCAAVGDFPDERVGCETH